MTIRLPIPLQSHFGDQRIDARCQRVRRLAAARPGLSFPRMMGSESEREALYRLLGNKNVTVEELLAPHFEATRRRMHERPVVLAVHDTTEFTFAGEKKRPGLGLLPNGQGFLGHVALAVAPEERLPLGVIGLETIFRATKRKPKRTEASRRSPDKESARWARLAVSVEERVHHPAVVHLMDREADAYELLAELAGRGSRFVIRVQYDRQAQGEDGQWASLSETMAQAPMVLEREVVLSRRSKHRPPGPCAVHPPRAGRTARLAVSAATVTLRRPARRCAALPPSLTVNVVRVHEIDPPPGEPAVQWQLVTTEPISTPAEVALIVDYYRARWVIEEYFKALKRGCRYEQRQLEGRASLLNALALFIPIAWRLLLFRTLARRATPGPASLTLTSTQIAVLETMTRRKLPVDATTRDALLAVAALGGHIKNNGWPGWEVIGRGYEDLLMYEAAWCAARGMEKSDQS
jgi:hypothetical protein